MNSRMRTALILFFFQGSMPLLVGIYFYVSEILLQYWKLGGSNYSLKLGHVAYTNLVATGISSLVVLRFGILKKQKWAWWFIFLLTFWVAGNDSFAVIYCNLSSSDKSFPVALFPFCFGLLGLFVSWREFFSPANCE